MPKQKPERTGYIVTRGEACDCDLADLMYGVGHGGVPFQCHHGSTTTEAQAVEAEDLLVAADCAAACAADVEILTEYLPEEDEAEWQRGMGRSDLARAVSERLRLAASQAPCVVAGVTEKEYQAVQVYADRLLRGNALQQVYGESLRTLLAKLKGVTDE